MLGTCGYLCTRMHACMNECVCVCVYIYIYICVYIYMCIYIYIYIYILKIIHTYMHINHQLTVWILICVCHYVYWRRCLPQLYDESFQQKWSSGWLNEPSFNMGNLNDVLYNYMVSLLFCTLHVRCSDRMLPYLCVLEWLPGQARIRCVKSEWHSLWLDVSLRRKICACVYTLCGKYVHVYLCWFKTKSTQLVVMLSVYTCTYAYALPFADKWLLSYQCRDYFLSSREALRRLRAQRMSLGTCCYTYMAQYIHGTWHNTSMAHMHHSFVCVCVLAKN
jgi:hypothetical protein